MRWTCGPNVLARLYIVHFQDFKCRIQHESINLHRMIRCVVMSGLAVLLNFRFDPDNYCNSPDERMGAVLHRCSRSSSVVTCVSSASVKRLVNGMRETCL